MAEEHLEIAAAEILIEGAHDAAQTWLNEDGEYTEEEFYEIIAIMRRATISVHTDELIYEEG